MAQKCYQTSSDNEVWKKYIAKITSAANIYIYPFTHTFINVFWIIKTKKSFKKLS